jgi:hypothetical protein
LAAGALYASFSAQYTYILAVRHQDAASMVEALLLDLLIIVFALLALACSGLASPAGPSGPCCTRRESPGWPSGALAE